jgi:hypothetical protein
LCDFRSRKFPTTTRSRRARINPSRSRRESLLASGLARCFPAWCDAGFVGSSMVSFTAAYDHAGAGRSARAFKLRDRAPAISPRARGATWSRSCRGRWPSWPDLGERWSSRLVATAAENRLSIRRNSHTSFAAASDCRTDAIYEYASLVREHVCSDAITQPHSRTHDFLCALSD